jgi:two-component system response regulator FlrC
MRAHDISYLAKHFIKVNSILNSKKIEKISLDALEILNAHSWPGNVRELENVIERAVLLSQGNEIKKENIFIDSVIPLSATPSLSVMTIAEMEKKMIQLALEKTNQNRTKAADLLGISIRTLRNKLQEYRENGEKQNG